MTSVFLAPCGQPTMQRPHSMQPVRSGPSPPKKGSGTVLPRLAEEDADGRLLVGVADAELLAELAQQLVGGVVVRVLRDAEHPLGLGVVGRERALPVLHVRPLRVLEEGLRRHVERVRVAEAAAADAAAGDDARRP